MKKAGFNAKKNDEGLVAIIVVCLIGGFIFFGMEPFYQLMGRISDGSLFEKNDVKEPTDVKPDVPVEDPYVILKPVGTDVKACKKIIQDDGGDKTISVYLNYTDNNLKSINAKYSYSGITEEYANYILSEQSKFRQRKNANIDNKGYSVEIDLTSTSSLKVSEVVLLENNSLEDISLDFNDYSMKGEYDQNIDSVIDLYIVDGYICD